MMTVSLATYLFGNKKLLFVGWTMLPSSAKARQPILTGVGSPQDTVNTLMSARIMQRLPLWWSGRHSFLAMTLKDTIDLGQCTPLDQLCALSSVFLCQEITC